MNFNVHVQVPKLKYFLYFFFHTEYNNDYIEKI